MKRDNLVRLARFKLSEKRRQLEQLELMMGEFTRMAAELDNQIVNEEKKSGISDIQHFAYPTFAKAARSRRDNLTNSVKDPGWRWRRPRPNCCTPKSWNSAMGAARSTTNGARPSVKS